MVGQPILSLSAVPTALAKVAAGTLDSKSPPGVFRASVSMSVNEIFAQLPEILRPGPANESKPVRKLRILGRDIAESDVEADLAKGVVGELGQKIRECAKNGGFPLNVLDSVRAGVTPQPKA